VQIVNFSLGSLVVVKRSLIIVGALFVTFWRLDFRWVGIDAGNATWCALVLLDSTCRRCVVLVTHGAASLPHRCPAVDARLRLVCVACDDAGRQNNPVVLVFCDLVFRDINERRRRRGLRPHTDEDYVSCPIPCCCCAICFPLVGALYPNT
jgi:hypothetical protein